ncbi:MAG TPA: hypothetical protein VF012_04640 [Nocardioidaceae bacterium]
MNLPQLAASALAAVMLGSCVPASPDADTYDDKAALTLGSAVSEARTIERVLDTLYDGRMLRPAAVTQLRYSEDALDTATDAFTELNPPPTRDRLNRQMRTLLGDTGDLLARARIAVERERVGDYPILAEDLRHLADRMARLEERVQ